MVKHIFHLAAESGQYSFFTILVSYLDAIVVLDGKQRNILHLAALNGNVVIVKLILTRFEIENLINSPDEDRNTHLYLAAKNFHENVVNVLSKNPGRDIQKFLTMKILKEAITARAFYPEDILQDDTWFRAMERDFKQIKHADRK
ncbi:hypothetical protein EZV62_009143 [Acer yangbiense]|uniref:Uncharacterized protein n=1 Tax=Acer yangbiense TaxID=1000413 RepID=A0A5C7IFP6_9ROSI|nr:hypothetical protein EZV62_009143 [Acer yangbiense]